VGAAAAATAACTPYTVEQPTVPAPQRRPRGIDPDVALAATVLADEQRMVDLIDATVEEHPRLREALALARDVHRTHVELLNDAVPEGATAAVSPAASPSVSPEVTPSPDQSAEGPASETPGATSSPVPRRRRAALADLISAEDALALLDKRSAFAAQSGAFARVLASMAAAAAQQAVLIAELRSRRRRR
jgi:hypothetical protein